MALGRVIARLPRQSEVDTLQSLASQRRCPVWRRLAAAFGRKRSVGLRLAVQQSGHCQERAASAGIDPTKDSGRYVVLPVGGNRLHSPIVRLSGHGGQHLCRASLQ